MVLQSLTSRSGTPNSQTKPKTDPDGQSDVFYKCMWTNYTNSCDLLRTRTGFRSPENPSKKVLQGKEPLGHWEGPPSHLEHCSREEAWALVVDNSVLNLNTLLGKIETVWVNHCCPSEVSVCQYFLWAIWKSFTINSSNTWALQWQKGCSLYVVLWMEPVSCFHNLTTGPCGTPSA